MWERAQLAVSAAAITQAPNVIPGDEMASFPGSAISRDKEVLRVVCVYYLMPNVMGTSFECPRDCS